jgi:hypothetical protein
MQLSALAIDTEVCTCVTFDHMREIVACCVLQILTLAKTNDRAVGSILLLVGLIVSVSIRISFSFYFILSRHLSLFILLLYFPYKGK